MNKIESFKIDIVANHITRQYVATIMLIDTYNRKRTLSYEDANIANLVTSVHDTIEVKHGKELADKIGVYVADQYYLYDSIARSYCNSKNIPYDPFVELDEHHRFIRQMRLLSYQ